MIGAIATPGLVSRIAVLLAVLHAAVASAAPPARPAPDTRRAAAAALFQQGVDDVQAGRTAEGCRKLGDSVATMPDTAAMAALADCDTAIGALGEAWELWRDLASSAPTAELRGDAATKAEALDKQLARVAIHLRGTAPADLLVTLNGRPVSPEQGAEHRVTPGRLVVVASATEIQRWTQRFDARQGETVSVEIDVAEAQTALRKSKRAQVIGLSFVAAGATVLAAGAVFGGAAYLDWRNARSICGGNTDHCASAGYPIAQTELASARQSASIASWSTAVGLGTVAVGLLISLQHRPHGGPADAETDPGWRAAPLTGSQTVGIALTRSLP